MDVRERIPERTAKAEEGKAQHMIVMLYEHYMKHIDELPEEYLDMMRERGEKKKNGWSGIILLE